LLDGRGWEMVSSVEKNGGCRGSAPTRAAMCCRLRPTEKRRRSAPPPRWAPKRWPAASQVLILSVTGPKAPRWAPRRSARRARRLPGGTDSCTV